MIRTVIIALCLVNNVCRGLVLSETKSCNSWGDVVRIFQSCFMQAKQNFREPAFSGNTVTRWYLRDYVAEECRSLWPSTVSCVENSLSNIVPCNNKATIMNEVRKHGEACDNGNVAGWVDQVLQRFSDFPTYCFPSTVDSITCDNILMMWNPPAGITVSEMFVKIQGLVQNVVSCFKQKLTARLSGTCALHRGDVYTYLTLRKPFPVLAPGFYIPRSTVESW